MRLGLRLWLLRRHGMAGMGVGRGICGSGTVSGMLRGEGGSGEAGSQEKGEQAPHALPPSNGRTVTTRIMPACMWKSRWQ